MTAIIDTLLRSTEPAIRYGVSTDIIGEDQDSPRSRKLKKEIQTSDRVRSMLASRGSNGRMTGGVYAKWYGPHWILPMLAEIGYPAGDESLFPIRDQVYEYWLDPSRTQERVIDREAVRYKSRSGVPIIDGRARRCASQEGNAIWSTVKLGIADARVYELARNLLKWQWPDGGWNCDRRAEAVTSSFWESLIPLRALGLLLRNAPSTSAQRSNTELNTIGLSRAVEAAAELYLSRRLYRRKSDGEVMNEDFVKLHFPCYWKYDVLFALKVVAEIGKIDDPRCAEALELLESLKLPDGGFPARRKLYKVSTERRSGGSPVDWGGVSRVRLNEWVTLDALRVFKAAGKPIT